MLTTIGLEHTEVLGDTRELIFAEKAAVIGRGAAAVFGPLDGLEAAAEEVCARAGARAHLLGRDVLVSGDPAPSRSTLAGERFSGLSVPTPAPLPDGQRRLWPWPPCRLLLGGLDAGAVRRALAATAVPGRLQIAGREPLLVADGAHNPHGVAALVEALAAVERPAPRVGVFAIMRDKAVDEMLALARAAGRRGRVHAGERAAQPGAAALAQRVCGWRRRVAGGAAPAAAARRPAGAAAPVPAFARSPTRTPRSPWPSASRAGAAPCCWPARSTCCPTSPTCSGAAGRGAEEYTSARPATREALAVARGSSSLIVRLLLWLLFLVAAAVVAFFVGYLIGPYVVTARAVAAAPSSAWFACARV